MTIALGLLLVQCLGLNLSAPLSWLTWALVLGAWLKRREARTATELRLVALLQLVSTGLLAAQMQGLLTSVLQLLTVTVALAGLLQLNQWCRCPPCCCAAPGCSWLLCLWRWFSSSSCPESLRFGPVISVLAVGW